MDVVLERCAALDIGKRELVACVRTPGRGRDRQVEVRTFETFTAQLEALGDWLHANDVTAVVMEATGQYWKPVWHVLEEAGFDLQLVNARHVKMMPGRKTDVADAVWLAELFEHGMLRSSFVPPQAIRELRDLTRYRKRLIQQRTSESQRISGLLEDAGIKLDSVASDVLTVSGRQMLKALVEGERDPDVLADLAKGRLRNKRAELRHALKGRFRGHHAQLIGMQLRHIEHLDADIAALDARIDTVIAPFSEARDRLDTIPGVGKRAAETIIAEIGVDMAVFPTPAQLASWAGLCPGNNITGGKRRSGHTRHGDKWLRDALTESAWGAARTRDTYLSAHFWHLARRIGKKKAAIAVAHSILVIAWHLLEEHADYQDLGPDWFAQRHHDRTTRRAVNTLQALGYSVTLQPVAAA
jgi:transposase